MGPSVGVATTCTGTSLVTMKGVCVGPGVGVATTCTTSGWHAANPRTAKQHASTMLEIILVCTVFTLSSVYPEFPISSQAGPVQRTAMGI